MDEATIRTIIQAEMNKGGGAPKASNGFAGFGDITKNPAANEAAQEMAGLTDDALGGGMMMDKGTNLAASGGGVMSPFEAAANGAKTALGGALLAKNMNGKQNAIKSLLRKPGSGAEADADLMSGMGMGGGQHSVQGNPDHVTDF